MAIAEAHLAARFNRPGHEIVDHYTYAHRQRRRPDGGRRLRGRLAGRPPGAGQARSTSTTTTTSRSTARTDLAFTEDVAPALRGLRLARPDASTTATTWTAIDARHRARPSAETRAALADHRAHAHRLRRAAQAGHLRAPTARRWARTRCALTKENLGWPLEPPFYIPDEALRALPRGRSSAGGRARPSGSSRFAAYRKALPRAGRASSSALMAGELPDGLGRRPPARSRPTDKAMATRDASRQGAERHRRRACPSSIGGSADLNPSTNTALKGMGDFESPASARRPSGRVGGDWSYAGRNLHFGVREHAMGAIAQRHGRSTAASIPYGATFLVFSDYMRPPIRLAALMELPVDLRLHPRQHRPGRGRPDPPAGRAPGRRCAPIPRPDRHPPRRRQRDRRGLARGAGDRGPARRR